jgi:TPR repeat protein
MLKYIPVGILLSIVSLQAQEEKNKVEGLSSILSVEIAPQQEMLNEMTFIDQLLPILQERAAKEDPLACFHLASFYHKHDPQKYEEKIIQLYTTAAEAHHPDACYALGVAYYNEDWGLRRTDSRLVKYLTTAAESGNGEAISYLALAYWHGFERERDIHAAIKWLDKAVELDDALGLCIYGILLRSKKDIEVNYCRAQSYLERAATKGCAHAMTQLGMMHQFGEGVEKNIEEAIRLYRQAITTEADEDQALLNLGVLYLEGKEVAQDSEAAQYYLELSADLGDRDAQCILGRALIKGEILEKNWYKGLKYLWMAAEQGEEDAIVLLDAESETLIDLAKEGDKVAQRVLGIWLMENAIFEENVPLGGYWLQMAAEQGDELAGRILKKAIKRSQSH